METIKLSDNRILRISQDLDACDPRKEWENLGTIYIADNRYFCGDQELDQDSFDPSEYVVCLPVYAYIHSGIVLATKPFDCRWDSGQYGWIVVSRETILKEYNEITPETIEQAAKVLQCEIETFSQYLANDVYGFEVVELSECDQEETIDSCWGFYGHNPIENGMIDHLEEQDQIAVRAAL